MVLDVVGACMHVVPPSPLLDMKSKEDTALLHTLAI